MSSLRGDRPVHLQPSQSSRSRSMQGSRDRAVRGRRTNVRERERGNWHETADEEWDADRMRDDQTAA
eukprot:3776965-Karenia_brevis.AAC.1